MTQPRRSFDGFVPRDAGSRPTKQTPQTRANSQSTPAVSTRPSTSARPATRIAKSEIDASLKEIDAGVKKPMKGRRKKQKSLRRRIIVWSILAVLAAIIAVGGWMVYKAMHATSTIFKGNGNVLSALVAPDKSLKTDQYGNTNILLLGTSESDPGHPGAQLTDSMMVVSFNQKTHQMFMISIPRDLWVTYPQPCSVGYSGKINATYECALGTNLGGISATQNDEQTAETIVATKVSDVTGAQIQYVAHMNLAVIQKVVDAVGGVDITIDSPDPRGILDRNFDWRCNYRCYLVKYPNGPAHLDGTHAMWLAQARNDSGGYGLPRGNFDREDNQRKIALATKDKAMSVGFLANPINVVNFLDALGSNIHTTIDVSEIKSFVDALKAIPTNNIASLDIQADSNVLTTGQGPDGSSIVRPTAGLEDYSGLQAYIAKLLSGGAPLMAEQATVDVLNGSGVAGAAQQVATDLTNAGITVGNVASITAGSYPKYTIYDLSKGQKPKTLAAIQDKLGVKTTSATLPAGVTSTAQFVVIVGAQSSASSQQ